MMPATNMEEISKVPLSYMKVGDASITESKEVVC